MSRFDGQQMIRNGSGGSSFEHSVARVSHLVSRISFLPDLQNPVDARAVPPVPNLRPMLRKKHDRQYL